MSSINFGQPLTGFIFARDFFTASRQSPSIFRISGSGQHCSEVEFVTNVTSVTALAVMLALWVYQFSLTRPFAIVLLKPAKFQRIDDARAILSWCVLSGLAPASHRANSSQLESSQSAPKATSFYPLPAPAIVLDRRWQPRRFRQ